MLSGYVAERLSVFCIIPFSVCTLSLSASHALRKTTTNFQRWRSGDWTFKAIHVAGRTYPKADINTIIAVLRSFITVDYARLTFIRNGKGEFLVLINYNRIITNFDIHIGIRTLSDMLHFQECFVKSTPFDFSSYDADPDLPLNPEAFCNLLRGYKFMNLYNFNE